MRKAAIFCTAIALALTFSLETAEAKSKAQTKREKIDAVAKDALNVVLTNRAKAKELYDKAYGYAVFDNLKISFIVSGGVAEMNAAKTVLDGSLFELRK